MTFVHFSNYLLRFLFFCFILLFSLNSKAGVFQCVKANGKIEFRDKPCTISDNTEQYFLPHQYQKTKTDPTGKKAEQMQERKIQQQVQTLTKNEQKEERLKASAEKKREKEKALIERRKLRCERLEEKIENLELQLQQGKRLKTYKRLEKELAHAQRMKKRYCASVF